MECATSPYFRPWMSAYKPPHTNEQSEDTVTMEAATNRPQFSMDTKCPHYCNSGLSNTSTQSRPATLLPTEPAEQTTMRDSFIDDGEVVIISDDEDTVDDRSSHETVNNRQQNISVIQRTSTKIPSPALSNRLTTPDENNNVIKSQNVPRIDYTQNVAQYINNYYHRGIIHPPYGNMHPYAYQSFTINATNIYEQQYFSDLRHRQQMFINSNYNLESGRTQFQNPPLISPTPQYGAYPVDFFPPQYPNYPPNVSVIQQNQDVMPIDLSPHSNNNEEPDEIVDVEAIESVNSIAKTEEKVNSSDNSKNEARIPRPMNAFMIFSKHHRSMVQRDHTKYDNRTVSKVLAQWWYSMDPESKSQYYELAREIKAKHYELYPDWKWKGRNSKKVLKKRQKKGGDKVIE